jgi:hypothetical protein
MNNDDFADVLDWLAIRMTFEGCHDSAEIASTMAGHMNEAVKEAEANIDLHLISIQPPGNASDLLERTGAWTFVWVGRVTRSHPLSTKQALKWIGECGELAAAMVEIHQFDVGEEIESFYAAPLMAIEAVMAQK